MELRIRMYLPGFTPVCRICTPYTKEEESSYLNHPKDDLRRSRCRRNGGGRDEGSRPHSDSESDSTRRTPNPRCPFCDLEKSQSAKIAVSLSLSGFGSPARGEPGEF
ncbi:hypothetical protein AAC387_Pa03g4533 [Persea americana]